ncbi:MAG: TlpA family protein disulfide reductase [Steroidobacteraceae bacterium]
MKIVIGTIYRRWALMWLALLLGSSAPGVVMANQTRVAFDSFELPLVDGSRFVNTGEYRGSVLVINYWRSDCPVCIAESTLLNQLADSYQGVAFMGIAIDDRISALRFLTRRPASYVQLYAPLAQTQLLHLAGNHSGGLPYTVVLDAQQRICARRLGQVEYEWLEAALRQCR